MGNNIEICPPRIERRISLSWLVDDQRVEIDTFREDIIDKAKDKARRAKAAGVKGVKLKWVKISHEAIVFTPLRYAYECERLSQDEADREEYSTMLAEHGEPDWDLLDLDSAALRRAGVKVWTNEIRPEDFGGPPLQA